MSPPPSIEEIYREHAGFVWRMLRRSGLSEADARDACQEVFLAAHRGLPSFEGRCAISTWLYTIARRVARDFKGRAHHRHEVADDDVGGEVDPAMLPSALIEERNSLGVLAAILDQLSEVQREVFVLHELEGLDGAAMAEILGVPVATVYSAAPAGAPTFHLSCSRFQAGVRFEQKRTHRGKT